MQSKGSKAWRCRRGGVGIPWSLSDVHGRLHMWTLEWFTDACKIPTIITHFGVTYSAISDSSTTSKRQLLLRLPEISCVEPAEGRQHSTMPWPQVVLRVLRRFYNVYFRRSTERSHYASVQRRVKGSRSYWTTGTHHTTKKHDCSRPHDRTKVWPTIETRQDTDQQDFPSWQETLHARSKQSQTANRSLLVGGFHLSETFSGVKWPAFGWSKGHLEEAGKWIRLTQNTCRDRKPLMSWMCGG